jgi:hypothetical protein
MPLSLRLIDAHFRVAFMYNENPTSAPELDAGRYGRSRHILGNPKKKPRLSFSWSVPILIWLLMTRTVHGRNGVGRQPRGGSERRHKCWPAYGPLELGLAFRQHFIRRVLFLQRVGKPQ